MLRKKLHFSLVADTKLSSATKLCLRNTSFALLFSAFTHKSLWKRVRGGLQVINFKRILPLVWFFWKNSPVADSRLTSQERAPCRPVPWPHYSAWSMRFGSRGASVEMRRFPRFLLGYVKEINWPRRPGKTRVGTRQGPCTKRSQGKKEPRVGWQTTQWTLKGKDISFIEWCNLFVFLPPLPRLPSSKLLFVPCDRFVQTLYVGNTEINRQL